MDSNFRSVIWGFALCKLDDLWRHNLDTKWVNWQNMEYLCKYWAHRVEILQDWSTTRTTHCDSGYDVTIATYSLADLYPPKMKNALFVTPESNGLSCACAVHICSHPLNEQHKQIRTLILPFEWRGPGTHYVAMQTSQWTYHGSLWWV